MGANSSDHAPPLEQRVLVVFNQKVKESRKVAEYYAAARKIPAANLCAISLSDFEPYDGTAAVPWEEFASRVKQPIRKCLDAVGRKKILYVVFTYGTPYKITSVRRKRGVSVDQFVADIWDDTGQENQSLNPYFALSQSREGEYEPFVSLEEYRARPQAKTVYSVWRLDAANAALARRLVDLALQGEQSGFQGQACFDRRFGPDMNAIRDQRYGSGDWDLHRAAQFAREAGIPVLEDSHEAEFGTSPAPRRCDNAILYAGWYSLDHYNDAFYWNPGAIGIHLDSASAANPRGGFNWAANAVKKGITITAGSITEPDLFGLPHPDGIVRNLLEGANVGDAFLRNTQWLKWMILQIGDPLYRPLAGRAAAARTGP
ncbi:MAG: TIGR03790 family protein [Terriglobales bacterium]